jgi:putative addiction module component (TIGR02574 family)
MSLGRRQPPVHESGKCYAWNMSTDELLAEVLRLPRDERTRVAEEVLTSLEEPEDTVAAAWAQELDRRSREISEGKVQPVDWETARTQILNEMRQRRASRSAP